MQTGPLQRLNKDSNEYIHVTCAMLNKDVDQQNRTYTLRRNAINRNVCVHNRYKRDIICSVSPFFDRHAASATKSKDYVLNVETKSVQSKQV